MDKEWWSHGWGLEEEPKPVKPFSVFRDPGVRKTRSLGELACRSPETLKRERSVV
jgi:hypothetical protein